MLLCFLIKFSHYTPGCLLFHMEKKTTRSFVSCHCRDIFTRGVYCICALTYAADWHKPPTVKHMAHISAFQRVHFVIFSFSSLTDRCQSSIHSMFPPLYWNEGQHPRDRAGKKKLKKKQRKKRRGPKRKQTELIFYCIQIRGITVIRKWLWWGRVMPVMMRMMMKTSS